MEVLNTRGVGKINDRQLTLYKMGAWFLCKVHMKLHYLLTLLLNIIHCCIFGSNLVNCKATKT